MDFLKANFAADWTPYFNVANIPAYPSTSFPTNRAPVGVTESPFTLDQNASFDIQLLNNRVEGASDADHQVIIRSTGHGPQESVVVVDCEVKLINAPPAPPAPLDGAASHVFVLIGWHVVDL
jgi:hypothetical protein